MASIEKRRGQNGDVVSVGGGTARSSAAAASGPPSGTMEWSRNLLHSFEELVEHLRELSVASKTGGGDGRAILFDGYLTVCALWQIVEDFLHRGFLATESKSRVASRQGLGAEKAGGGTPKGWIRTLDGALRSGPFVLLARSVDALAGILVEGRILARESGLVRASARLRRAVERVAGLVGAADGRAETDERLLERFREHVEAILSATYPGALRQRVMKIPQCFKDFDCHPEDCRELARKFAETFETREGPLTVLGVRTSGAYLGPLCGAYLVERGFTDCSIESIRPGVKLLSSERRRFGRKLSRGLVLIIDDPPFTGDALLGCVSAVEGMGVPGNRIVALVLEEPGAPFFRKRTRSHASAWEELQSRVRTILLPKDEWRIRRMFAGGRDGADGVDGLREMRILEVGRLPFDRAGARAGDRGAAATGKGCPFERARGHEKVKLEVIHEPPRGGRRPRFVAKGSGIGWFQDHVIGSAHQLRGLTPPVSRLGEGVVLLPWVAGTNVAENPAACDATFVRDAARYVAERARALPLGGQGNVDLEDRKTGWHLLARAFGQSYMMLRSLSYYGLRKELSRIGRWAPRVVIDGRMGPAEWILPEGGGPAVKVDFEEHGFDRRDLSVFDPVVDLAGFSVEHRLPVHLEGLLMSEYVNRSGDVGALDRLPACKMMVCLSRQSELRSQAFDAGCDPREVTIEILELERALSNVANELLASAYRAPNVGGESDRVVAIDGDGVLEDSVLGFNAMTPAGVKAVRTFVAHGWQPILATGRSLREVADRCRALGLRGGIAEYGAVLWDAEREAATVLQTHAESADLRRLRRTLAQYDEFVVDPAYEYSVRLYHVNPSGSRKPVPVTWVEDLLRRWKLDGLRVIEGKGQTDVVGMTTNKGEGLRYWRRRSGVREVAAIGDTMEDLPLFRAADRCFAPANVRADLVAAMGAGSLRVVRGRTQRGLLQIAREVAHGATGCSRGCDDVDPGEGREAVSILVKALGLRDRSRLQKLRDLANRDALKSLRASL